MDENRSWLFFHYTALMKRLSILATVKVVLLFFLLGAQTICCAQEYLMFQKNKRRTAFYKQGDEISFRLHNDKTKYTFQILGFEDSVMVLGNYRINPKEVSHLYVDNKTKIWYVFKYKYEKIFFLAGVGYFVASVINEQTVTKETATISGSLGVAAIFARLLVNDKIRIKGKRRLMILDNCP